MAEDKEDKKQEAPKKAFPVKAVLTIAFVVVNLAGSVGGLFLVYMATLGMERKHITEATELASLKKTDEDKVPDSIIYTMEPLTVNLDGTPHRIIRAVISLEMMDDRGFEEVVRMGAQPRDQIVRLFNHKTFSDVESIQGKLTLKDEISTIVNSKLKDGIVKDVYFNEFVVQ